MNNNSIEISGEHKRKKTQSSIATGLLIAFMIHTPLIVSSNRNAMGLIMREVDKHVGPFLRERARTKLLAQARLDQANHRFQPERFIVQAEAIERSFAQASLPHYIRQQDTLFAEVKRLIQRDHFADHDAVRYVTAQRFRYESGSSRVTEIPQREAINCEGFTLQAAILFLRLGTPNIYFEEFRPLGNPPVNHVTLVMQYHGHWYDIRDGKRTREPNKAKLVPIENLLNYYITTDESRDRMINETEQALFRFPQQDFSYPGGIIFRAPPAGRSEWNTEAQARANTPSSAPTAEPDTTTSNSYFLYHMGRVWEKDFVHRQLAPAPYGSNHTLTTQEAPANGSVEFTHVPSTTLPAPPIRVTSSDLPPNPLEATADDASGFATVFNQIIRRREQPETDHRIRAAILTHFILVTETRLARAPDLSDAERSYLLATAAQARTARAMIANQPVPPEQRLPGAPANDPLGLTMALQIHNFLLVHPERRVEMLQIAISNCETESPLMNTPGNPNNWLTLFLFLPETRDILLEWIQHQPPTLQAMLVVGLRTVLKRTVQADTDLERRILVEMNLSENHIWQRLWNQVATVPAQSYEAFRSSEAIMREVAPLYQSLLTGGNFSPAEKAAYTLQVAAFLALPNPGTYVDKAKEIIYSAWYYAIGPEPPDERIETVNLWEIVATEDPPIEQQNLAAAWQEVQRSMSAPIEAIR